MKLKPMTIINILGDGTVYPSLLPQDLIIQVNEGRVSVGKFDKTSFILDEKQNYLTEPTNATDIKADVVAYINAEMPDLFGKREVIHIICPHSISAKATWKRD